MEQTARPILVVNTNPVNQHASNDSARFRAASSISMYTSARMLDSPSPLDHHAVHNLEDDEPTPLVVSPSRSYETAHCWGPRAARGSLEYKQWFNDILLHDLDSCIAHIKTYANDKRRTAHTEDINNEIAKRTRVLCDGLTQCRGEIKETTLALMTIGTTPVDQGGTEEEMDSEVEAWMNLKSHLAVEVFCSYDEIMRRACGTWQMGGIEEARGQVGQDWEAESKFTHLLAQYRRLCMR